MIVCGISTGFPVLFPTPGQITHVLLTRAPLYSGSCPPFLARLACVRHAASVRSEPGSNSPVELETPPLPGQAGEGRERASLVSDTRLPVQHDTRSRCPNHCVGTFSALSKSSE